MHLETGKQVVVLTNKPVGFTGIGGLASSFLTKPVGFIGIVGLASSF